jgi:hypothetical protein
MYRRDAQEDKYHVSAAKVEGVVDVSMSQETLTSHPALPRCPGRPHSSDRIISLIKPSRP